MMNLSLRCLNHEEDMCEVFLEPWSKISLDYLNKLTARMPKVFQAITVAKGRFFDQRKL